MQYDSSPEEAVDYALWSIRGSSLPSCTFASNQDRYERGKPVCVRRRSCKGDNDIYNGECWSKFASDERDRTAVGNVLTQEIQIVQQAVLVHSNKHSGLGVPICEYKFIIPGDRRQTPKCTDETSKRE